MLVNRVIDKMLMQNYFPIIHTIHTIQEIFVTRCFNHAQNSIFNFQI